MTTIAVSNIKGGVGKTSTATALAGGLKLQNQKANILLVDADPQGSIKTQFGLKLHASQGDFSSFLIDNSPFEDAVQKVKTEAGPIDVMISSRRLSDADSRMAAYPRRDETLKLRMKKQDIKYDYIIFDTSPAMNLVTLNVLTFADYILIPVTMDAFAISNIKYLIDQVKVIDEFYDKAPEVLGILPSLYDKRLSMSQQGLEAVRKIFGKDFNIFPPIGIDSTIKKAQVKKQFIYEFPNSRAAEQYKGLTKDILGRI